MEDPTPNSLPNPRPAPPQKLAPGQMFTPLSQDDGPTTPIAAPSPLLQIQNLTKGYDRRGQKRFWRRSGAIAANSPASTSLGGDRLALNQLSLSLQSGEIYGLLGPNGAGKTTTINLICNLLAPDSGLIQIAGQPVSEATKRLVGVVPQQDLLYGSLTCAENLRFFARLYGLPRAEQRDRIAHCLAQVNLTNRAHSTAESLSGGMKRRLSIALALVHRPKLVILDEPTTGLDIEARYELWELIRQLKVEGVTVLLTTHLLEEAERLCDRIGIIRQGTLLREGSLAELRKVVQAAAIAQIDSADEMAVRQRAAALGWPVRQYGSGVALWLPQTLDLRSLLAQLDGIAIGGATLHPVSLEHIYLEVTRGGATGEAQQQA
jgi:ABC-2 type transport system ATP-binding protein